MAMNSVYSTSVSQMILRRDQRIALPLLGTPLRHQHFTVQHERKEVQLLAWRDYLDRFLDVPVTCKQLAHGFRGEINAYVLPDMIYLDSRTGPVSQRRDLARISRDSVRDFVFHVAVDGMMETTTALSAVRASQYTPGILALDMCQPMLMVRPTAARVLAFFLPRATVEAALPDPEAIHGRVLGYTTPLTRLILERIRVLCTGLTVLSNDDRAQEIRLCAQLILAAFSKQQRLADHQRAAIRAALQRQIEEYIQANLQNDDLSPESVMAAFPVARSTIYRMFVPQGGLHAYIRHCRLFEAARELVAMPLLSVSEIGYGLGFASASDFSRAFSRQFNMSPRDYRARVGVSLFQNNIFNK